MASESFSFSSGRNSGGVRQKVSLRAVSPPTSGFGRVPRLVKPPPLSRPRRRSYYAAATAAVRP